MKYWVIAVAIALVASACGGSDAVANTATTGVADSATAGDAPVSTATTPSTTTPTTTTEASTPGSDPQGDVKASADDQTVEGPGVDIGNVLHKSDVSGSNCFIIDVYGDGEATAAGAGNYLIGIEVVDPDSEGGGWGGRVEYRQGTLEPGSVRIGVLASGRSTLEGAIVTAAWDDSDTVRMCVDSGETSLGVETFNISIFGFGTTNGDVYDEAEGVGAP